MIKLVYRFFSKFKIKLQKVNKRLLLYIEKKKFLTT